MSLALRGETVGAPSALDLTEDLFDEEFLYFLGGPVVWPGSAGTEADTASGGAVTVGAVVAGSQGTEADAARAGTATVGTVVGGSQGTETDAGQSGSNTVGAHVAGGQGTETDTAQSGTSTVGVNISGGQAEESDEAFGGGVSTGGMVVGGSVEETDEARGGTTTTATVVAGSKATEADTATGGTVVIGEAPPPPPGTLIARTAGRSRSGVAVVSWEPAVVAAPSVMVAGSHRRIRAAAYGPVTMVGTRPTFTVSNATAPRTRTRILVGGKDVSFFRGVPTPEPGYQLAEPLMWGPTSITFPQVSACFETAGVGDLSWCAKGKPVKFQRVTDDGTIVATDYRGVVVAHDISGRNLRLEVGGHGQGRASLRYKPSPIFRDTLDLGRLAWAAIRDMGLQFSPRLGPTSGMKSALIGGMTHLDYISELCAKAWKRNGTQWTLMPNDDAVYTFAPKDTTTVDFTVFTDDARSVPDLRSDAAEEPNRIFPTGVTPKGQRVRFGVYPGLLPGPAAPYPFADDSNLDIGTTDADTDTGDGITVMVRRLWTAGYLSLEEADGTFDADVENALAALQKDAGLTGPVGVMTPALWRALFDLDTTGYTLRGSRIEPAAEADNVQRYDRAAGGAVIGKHDGFDPHALIVDRSIDFGSGFTRHQMREWSRAEIDRGQDNWVGTISLNTGAVLVGEVNPGDAITDADLMDVRAIKPGMNAWLPQFAGGILVHVSVVDVDTQDGAVTTGRLTVDTQARDALAVWEVIRRNKETRRDSARRWTGNRASGQVKDSITEWDEVAGIIAGDRSLVAGWNRVQVIGATEGTVSWIRTHVTAAGTIDGIEYAIAVFGKPITVARLNHLVPAPLDADGDMAWWEKAEQLERREILYAAGTNEQPCGYGRGDKAKGADLTGVHVDDANFSYRCGDDNLIDVMVWVGEDAAIEGGRVMHNQLEAGA